MSEDNQESLHNYDISLNTVQVLVRNNVKTLTELRKKTEQELRKIPGMNSEQMREITRFLKSKS